MSNPVVHFSDARIYQKDHLVLEKVNFQIDKGTLTFLIGPTGSGKSSLLRTIYGDLPLQHGKGQVLDFDLSTLRTKQIPSLRRRMGIVFQDFQLLTDRTINDNLLFVLKATGWKDRRKMNQRIEEVLNQVGMVTKAFKMPHEVSGGEQQRVGIARALLNDPELILADEPSGNLDPDTSKGIMRLLVNIAQSGTAVLMASHDYLMMDEYPNRTIRCEGGTLIDSKQKVVSGM